jgi:hypothetical protein
MTQTTSILRRTDPLLGRDSKQTAVLRPLLCNFAVNTPVQQYVDLLLETVLWNPLLGSCNSSTITMETGLFSVWYVPRSYLEDNWGDPVWWEACCVKWPPEWESFMNRQASSGVVSSVELCTGGREDRTWARETEESPLFEAVSRERLLKTMQSGEGLACAVVICELWRLAVAL